MWILLYIIVHTTVSDIFVVIEKIEKCPWSQSYIRLPGIACIGWRFLEEHSIYKNNQDSWNIIWLLNSLRNEWFTYHSLGWQLKSLEPHEAEKSPKWPNACYLQQRRAKSLVKLLNLEILFCVNILLAFQSVR